MTDKFYQNRNNLSYYMEQGIRLSGCLVTDQKKCKDWQKYGIRRYTDWIAVERAFTFAKHNYDLELITSRLKQTFLKYRLLRCKQHKFMLVFYTKQQSGKFNVLLSIY